MTDDVFLGKNSIPTLNLPTPPSTAHRDKENRAVIPGGSRVAWSLHNKYHSLAAPLKPRSLNNLTNSTPSRSILKQPTVALLPVPETKEREITPEPSDPLINLTYLEYPVSKIVALDASLRDLIEGYNILAARLRSSVTSSTDADSSWPLFQPMRKNKESFVKALARDLGRALQDPSHLQTSPLLEPEEDVVCVDLPEGSLPSPKSTPKKKKRGMTAEQVKYARDLCTISHSVIKLLAILFTTPAIHRIFTDNQLRIILEQALEIPLAEELPTPNARKTNALVIWLIQVQRLPAEVLMPLREKIAMALQRGMDGQLGKEGKKGSASDGLKAIHDLCLFQPRTFAPSFVDLLPSILSNLLAPTLALRTQSCHALGGLVLGITSIPQSHLHTRASRAVAHFLLSVESSPKRQATTPLSSPTKLTTESVIVRTLRTTLNAHEPEQAAQGPVWALSILGSFVVLLSSTLCNNAKLSRVIYSLLSLAMRHKKSSVRALACIVWRCMAWVYLQPPLPPHPDGESEVESDQDTGSGKEQETSPREYYWKVLKSVVELQAGVATIAALLGDEEGGDDAIQRSLYLLKVMMSKGGRTCSDAMETMRQLVGLGSPSLTTWNCNHLLSKSLFSSNPGLLTVEFKSLASVVQPMFDETPGIEDVRPLTREELAKDWVFEGLLGIWRDALSCLEMFDENEVPSEVVAVWDGLLKANVSMLQESGDNSGISEFAIKAVDVLIEILQDGNFVVTPRSTPPNTNAVDAILDAPDRPQLVASGELTNGLLKLRIIRELWMSARNAVPTDQLDPAGERLLACLMKNEDEFADSSDHARSVWAALCAEVVVVCEEDALKAFWGYIPAIEDKIWDWSWSTEARSLVWRTFVKTWQTDGESKWEGFVNLLGVPLMSSDPWELSTDDLNAWEDFLLQTTSKALDYGVDSFTVLDTVARSIIQNRFDTQPLPARVADILVSQLEMSDAREVPAAIFEFMNATIAHNYPIERGDVLPLMWMIRSVTRAVTATPGTLVKEVLELLQDGFSLWIADKHRVWSQSEYTYDIIPLYEACLVALQSLPPSVEILRTFATLLDSAFIDRDVPTPAAKDAFIEFWSSKYADMLESSMGWPRPLLHCLDVCDLKPPPAPGPVAEMHDVIEIYSSDEEVVADGTDSLQTTIKQSSDTLISPPASPQRVAPRSIASSPFVGVLKPAFFPSPSASPTPPPKPSGTKVQVVQEPSLPPRFKSSTFVVPSTPQSSSRFLLRACTPPRPTKASPSPFPRGPASGSPPSSPVHTPLRMFLPETPKRNASNTSRSPFKRRRVTPERDGGDKENDSTGAINSIPATTSVLTPLRERAYIGTGKWLKPRSSNKKKRPLSTIDEDAEESERPLKRNKVATEPVLLSMTNMPEKESDSDFEDEQLVADSLLSESTTLVSTLHVQDAKSSSSGTATPASSRDIPDKGAEEVPQAKKAVKAGRRITVRKRYKMVLDAVVVPRLRDLYGEHIVVEDNQESDITQPAPVFTDAPTTPTKGSRGGTARVIETTVAASLVSAELGLKDFAYEFTTPTNPRREAMRKARTQANANEGDLVDEVADGNASRKRRRSKEYDGQGRQSESGDMIEEDPFQAASLTPTAPDNVASSAPSSPISALHIVPGSDDSISFPVKGRVSSLKSIPESTEVPSSDDDPHLGQVTPHHLISPVIRRTRTIHDSRLGTRNVDPPSDDSIVSAGSPSREVATRRLRRFGSSGGPMTPKTEGSKLRLF